MYKNEKIGIGVITYNREESFKNVINAIKDIDYLDEIIIIKHQDKPYKKYHPKTFVNDKIKYKNVINDLGVASVKNAAMKELLNKKCDHIFTIEDDLEVIDKNVFKYYIDAAKKNNIDHLNFCHTLKNSLCNINGLSFYGNLCGVFQYFTRRGLDIVGLMDERYINALEHVEHSYRFHLMGLTAPKFHIFPDIENSVKCFKFKEDNETSIIKTDEYHKNLINAFKYFYERYGIEIKNIQPPTYQELINFYAFKQQMLRK
jgi:GT2 family glycosyltransferase